jgi:hypothetical protein
MPASATLRTVVSRGRHIGSGCRGGREPALKRLHEPLDVSAVADPGNAPVGADQHRRICISWQAANAREAGGETGRAPVRRCVEQHAVAVRHLPEQGCSRVSATYRAIAFCTTSTGTTSLTQRAFAIATD